MLLALLAPAFADGFAARALLRHPFLDVRGGVTGDVTGVNPALCAALSPTAWLSFEGCGPGAGFLYPSKGPDLAHFRARARVLGVREGRVELDGLVGAGLAEAERAADAPGFRMGAQAGEPVETAGPEASLTLTGRAWVHPSAYVLVDLNAGAAYMAEAPRVVGTAGPIVPFVGLSAGAGF
ncbi:MAG: hypothetical protein ACOZNI_06835 [Myxococcota bacterium]